MGDKDVGFVLIGGGINVKLFDNVVLFGLLMLGKKYIGYLEYEFIIEE